MLLTKSNVNCYLLIDVSHIFIQYYNCRLEYICTALSMRSAWDAEGPVAIYFSVYSVYLLRSVVHDIITLATN